MMALLAFAFGAGLVSPLNPCGFALLPAYLGAQLGADQRRANVPVAIRLWRGLAAGGALSAGFAGVLVSIGLLVALGLRPVLQVLPPVAVGLGLVLVVTGIAVLVGRRLPSSRLSRLAALRPVTRDGTGLLAFGAGYAVASAACTVAILLAVVGQAVATGTFAGMLAVLLAYGAGAASLLTALSVSAAATGSVLAARLRGALRFMQPLSGVLLIASGGYLIATNLAVVRDTAIVSAVAGRVADASTQASSAVQSAYLWFAPVLLVLLVLLVLAGALALARRRAHPGPAADTAHGKRRTEWVDCCPAGAGAPGRKADAAHDAQRTP
jgi:cytochrome c-type biogenesis protein